MTQTPSGDFARQQPRRRKGWVAVLLSVLLTGLGQMYNGELLKGAGFLLLSYSVSLGLLLLGVRWRYPVYFPLLVLPGLFVKAAAALDAWRSARRIGAHFTPARYHRLAAYLGVFLVFGVLVSGSLSRFIRRNIVQAFKVSAASMEPTLLPGDHILVDKSAGSFARGDLAAFVFPGDVGKAHPRVFIKRIVGLPGDEVEIRDKRLFLNGRQIQEPYVIHVDARTLPAANSPRDFFGPVTVPQDSYFMLGDNRDRSYDSRFWGFVGRGKLLGRPLEIYWSWDRKRQKVRWQRIGKKL